MKKRTATVLKWMGIAAVVLALVYSVLLWTANRALSRAYAALVADGRPMKAEQIIPAELPDADNAALVYEAAVLRLKAEPAGEENLFTQMGELASKMLAGTSDAQARAQFHQFAQQEPVLETLASLQKGAAKTGCRYDLDYTKGDQVLLPHVSDLRDLSRILCATARTQADAGDHEAAWGTVITSLRLADALREEPLLVSQLVRIAQFVQTSDTIQTLAAVSSPLHRQYEELDSVLVEFEDVAGLFAAVDGERLLLGEWGFNLPRSDLRKIADGGTERAISLGTIFVPLLRRDHAAYLTVMHAYARNATAPYSLDDAVLEEELIDAVPRYCILTRMLTPALSVAKARYVSMIAQARVTRAGLAALQCAKTQGAFPQYVDELDVGNVEDPFTGKPLVYRTTESGFIIYSVGEDLVDDGGKPNKEKVHEGDVVWEFRREEKAEPEN